MSVDVYKFDISCATDAGTLHAYRDDVMTDATLQLEEVNEVLQAINERFGELNRATNPNPKPRW